MEDIATTSEATLHDLFSRYVVVREMKNEKDRELDEIDEELTALSEQIIPLMTELEYQSVNHRGKKHWLSVSSRPSIVAETRDEFMGALEEEKEDGIIQHYYINSNTLYGWHNNLPENLKEKYAPYLNVSEKVTLHSSNDYKRSRKKK